MWAPVDTPLGGGHSGAQGWGVGGAAGPCGVPRSRQPAGAGLPPSSLMCLLPLPAGTLQAWWAWPPAASRLQWKALSPAPCPCPMACPPCPTHPMPLLLAKPSSPRQIETMQATSCSWGGALRPWRRRAAPSGRRVQSWWPRAADCPGARRARGDRASPASTSCPVLRAGCRRVLCVLVKQKN